MLHIVRQIPSHKSGKVVMKQKIKFLLCSFTTLFSLMASQTALASSEREALIKNTGELRVCIWPEYFSISYKNVKTNKLEGIDIALAKEFAKDLNAKVRFVPTHFGIFMNDIEQDKCDIAMFGVGRTEKRMQRVDFSQPYLSSGMYGIASKAHPIINSWENMDQPGVIVSVQKGTYMDSAMRSSLKHAKVMSVTRPSQREVEVRSGRADVFITDYPYGQKMIRNYDWAQLLTPKEATKQFKYAYAVKKGQPKWLARVDQFVSSIKQDGRLHKHAKANNLLPIIIK